MYVKQKTIIAKLNKPYSSMHKDYFEQCPQKIRQKYIDLKNSADAKFGKIMTVCDANMLTRPDKSRARASQNTFRNPCYSIIAPTLLACANERLRCQGLK
jgi:hypothetical protein